MKLFWKFYAFLFLAIASGNAVQLLDRNSDAGEYYQAILAFDHHFFLAYLLNILQALTCLIIAVFIAGYAFDIKPLSKLPAWFFVLRLLLDILGRNFQFKTIVSYFYISKYAGLFSVAALVIPILPSYVVQWKITFPFPDPPHKGGRK